ncbi:hypothetical protein [Lichenihabitans psoromatis]|uniref:hypothetical protein n=1 Tax=Lichenihabitans psoromatis TaxID=2528642 RepID=UPI001035AB66|nr:hypothetical protein [Lichenihabitans psoromatis]
MPGADTTSHAADFNVAASAGLQVHGNEIDTGRYIITGSTSYRSPTSGGNANDGMVKIFDTTNNSFVEVYGDPHIYTSAGDRANFQHDGLTIKLSDGTEVQFKQTAEVNGVSYIDQVAVTKDNQTVIQSGFHDGSASVKTGSVQQGGPSSAQGFNDVSDTVLHVGNAGSLDTLVNAMGSQLNSKTYENSVDGMGGGYAEFGSNAGTKAIDQYSKAMADNAGTGNGPQAAEEPKGATSTIPSVKEATTAADAGPASAGGTDLASLIKQLISLLQQQLPTSTSATGEAKPTTDAAASPVTTTPVGGQNDLTSLIQQLISLLDKSSGGTTAASSADEAGLIKQLITLLQQTPAASGAGSTGAPADEASLIKQLITLLQPQGAGVGGETQYAVTPKTNPGEGISQTEVDQMLAVSNGTGPEVRLTGGAGADQAVPTSYNPAMGISGAQINAMLAHANGQGPEVNFADYDQAAATYSKSQTDQNQA